MNHIPPQSYLRADTQFRWPLSTLMGQKDSKGEILRQMLTWARLDQPPIFVTELYRHEQMQGETRVIIGEFKGAFWPGTAPRL